MRVILKKMMRWEKADPISIKGTFFLMYSENTYLAQSSKEESKSHPHPKEKTVNDAEEVIL